MHPLLGLLVAGFVAVANSAAIAAPQSLSIPGPQCLPTTTSVIVTVTGPTVTIPASPTFVSSASVIIDPESAETTYYFMTESGTTHWLSGTPPSSDYTSTVTSRTTVVVTAVNPTTVVLTPSEPAVPSSVGLSQLTSSTVVSVVQVSSVNVSSEETSVATLTVVLSPTSTVGNGISTLSTLGTLGTLDPMASSVVSTASYTSTPIISTAVLSSVRLSSAVENVTTTTISLVTVQTSTIVVSATTQDSIPTMSISSSLLSNGSATYPISKSCTNSKSSSPISTMVPSNITTSLSTIVSTVRPTTLNATVSSSTSTSSPTPSHCGEWGRFTLDWDDQPGFFPTDPENAPTPPIFSPYHHLYFADGYGYVPPPDDPYPPVSPPRLAVFAPYDNDEDGPGVYPGMIGAGPRASIDAYWFNAYGAWFGCDYGGENPCTLRVSAYNYDAERQGEVMVVSNNFTVPSCPDYKDCQLQRVDFGDDYQGVSGLQIEMFVNASIPAVWWMDDLHGGWWNNTCAAGLLRQMTR